VSDSKLRAVPRAKIRHNRHLYINRPEPIAFMPVAVDTSGRVYDDLSRLLFLHAHREVSALVNELPEESEKFRFLRVVCLGNIKWSVGLILVKALGALPTRYMWGVFHVNFISDFT
jgi:hypothetical protein